MSCYKCQADTFIVMLMSGREICKPHYDEIRVLEGEAVNVAYRVAELGRRATALHSYNKTKEEKKVIPFKKGRWTK